MALAERAELTARLSLKDEFSGKLKGAAGAMKDFDKSASNTGASLGRTGQNIERLAAVGIGAFVGAVGLSIKAAGNFEESLHTINTVAGATPEALGKIGDSIRQLSRDTGTPLEDLTSAYYDLVSAGIKTADAQKVLTAANTLAIGGLATTAQTVDLLTTAINAYGGDASKATQYADAFAEAIAAGKVTAAEISESFAQIGPLAAQSGIELNEIAAALAVMTANGTPAAEAFTQMRSALVALQKPTGDLEALQKKLNVNFLEIAQEKGLAFAYNEIQKAADAAGIEMVTLTGRVEGSLFAAQVAGPNFAKYSAELDKVGKSAGTASDQMAERQQGLNFQLAKLSANLKDAGISIGSALLPKLTPLVEKFNDFLAAHPEQIAAIGTNIADGFTKIADAAGKVDWTAIGTNIADGFTKIADAAGKVDWTAIGGGLEITGRAAKTLVDAFLSLPPDMQKLVVAAIAINKGGGGIITSGIKDIVGLVLSRLTTIQAANVTVVGANVTGTGAGPAGAGALGFRDVLKGLTALGIVALVEQAVISTQPSPKDFGVEGSLQPLTNPFDFPGLFNNLSVSVQLLQKALSGDQTLPVDVKNFPQNSPAPDRADPDLVTAAETTAAKLSAINDAANAARDDINAQRVGTLDAVKAIEDGNALVKVYGSGTALAQRGAEKANEWVGRNMEILKGLQEKFLAAGDTATAAKLGEDIDKLRLFLGVKVDAVPTALSVTLAGLGTKISATIAALPGGLPPPIVNVSNAVTVKTNVFGTTAETSVYSRYNSSNGAIVV